jgi:hypothetical protein
MNNFYAGSVPRWTPLQTAFVTGLNAFGCATILGEAIPMFWSQTLAWSHTRHFTVVGAIFTGLFALQYLGVRAIIESHVG